jgi:phosphatidylinositol glycan class M
MLPNAIVPQFGKHLFAVADAAAAYIMALILHSSSPSLPGSPRISALAASSWSLVYLASPLAVNMSTRGSCDALVVLLLVSLLYALQRRKWVVSGFILGFSVHLRLFPVIYLPAVLVHVVHRCAQDKNNKNNIFKKLLHFLWRSLGCLPMWRVLAAAGAAFATLLLAGHRLYGWRFVHEAYLYHFTRTDTRHNFSPFFLGMYLTSPAAGHAVAPLFTSTALAMQLLLLAAALPLAYDLPACFFLQTLGFVALNKVCTAQYFLWWTAFLPFVLPRLIYKPVSGASQDLASNHDANMISGHDNSVSIRTHGDGLKSDPTPTHRRVVALIACVGAWFLAEAHWLLWGYELEVLGNGVWRSMWFASMIFAIVNIGIYGLFCRNYAFSMFKLDISLCENIDRMCGSPLQMSALPANSDDKKQR